MKLLRYPFYLIPFCMTGLASAQATGLTLESGFYSSKGDYQRDSATTIQYLPLAVKYQTGTFQFKISGGWLWLDGPGHIEAGTQVAGNYKENGWSDTYLSNSYWWHTPWLKQIDWIAPELKIKFPTADKNKALGTGEYDTQLLLSFYRTRSSLTLHSTISRRWRGDRSDLNMHDSNGFTMGAAYSVNKILDVGLMYDREQAASALSYPKSEMVLHSTVKVTKQLKATLYSQLGLDQGSPDVSFGTQFGYKF